MDEIDALDLCPERQIWLACLRQAFSDALSVGDSEHGTTPPKDRDEARRWLLSAQDASARRLVISLCGYDISTVEKRAREKLRPLIAAERIAESKRVESDQERAEREALAEHLDLGGSLKARGWMRKGLKKRARAKPAAPKPAAPQWDSNRLFDFLAQHEKVLAAAEVEQGLVERERRAELERMARKSVTRAEHYDVPAIAAE
jgi:hypothetical protein